MKRKISVTLSTAVLAGIDQLAGQTHSRSAVVENVLRRFLREKEFAAGQARDLVFLNHAADSLNLEASDVLDYQRRNKPY